MMGDGHLLRQLVKPGVSAPEIKGPVESSFSLSRESSSYKRGRFTDLRSNPQTVDASESDTDTQVSSVVSFCVSSWGTLEHAKELYSKGAITEEEYERRKYAIIDELTGTKSKKNDEVDGATEETPLQVSLHKDQPDWESLEWESVVEHYYNPSSKMWQQKPNWVKTAPHPFAAGGLRLAYYLKCQQPPVFETIGPPEPADAPKAEASSSREENGVYVGKFSADPFEGIENYMYDVEVQLEAKQWARMFNALSPPKKVDILKAAVLEFCNRPGAPVCGIERFIDGTYYKYNNNFGYVREDERNTPQAFSHFTYHASGGQLLICDIQGVDDLYTDPQIHSPSHKRGKGNMGKAGIDMFLETHHCNEICKFLKLPMINKKVFDKGTLPACRTLPSVSASGRAAAVDARQVDQRDGISSHKLSSRSASQSSLQDLQDLHSTTRLCGSSGECPCTIL
mmetsp:Transcript_29408/g.74012  ORF Transcript_29408/g.74012 Transcript_29408/m.74012 type:complete len:453 (-) Transcript_29408:26-1384(-)